MRGIGIIVVLMGALLSTGFEIHAASKNCRNRFLALGKTERAAKDKVLFRAVTDFYRRNFRLPGVREIAALAEISQRDVADWIKAQKGGLMERFESGAPQVLESVRNAVAKEYLSLSLSRSRTPGEEEMAQALGLDVKDYQALFGKEKLFESLEALKARAEARAPTKFKNVIDADLFSEKYEAETIRLLSDAPAIIATSIIAGFPIPEVTLKSLLRLAEEKDAIITIRAINGEVNGLKDPLLQHPRVRLLTSDSYVLTPEIALSDYTAVAKFMDPLMGTDSFGKRHQTLIMAAPKLRMRPLASPRNPYRTVWRMTTGTISDSNYHLDHEISKRTDKKASTEDVLGHYFGAVLLERTSGDGRILKGEKILDYHVRNIKFVEEFGGWFDLNKFYTADRTVDMQAAALVLGDSHIAVADQSLLASLGTLIRAVNPRAVALHDVLDADSISPHEKDMEVTKSQKSRRGRLDLKAELSNVVAFMNAIHRVNPELDIVLIPSNHPNWLYGYLQSGAYKSDPENARLGAELRSVMDEGLDPLKYVLMNGYKKPITRDAKSVHMSRETLLDAGLDYPHKVIFKDRGEPWAVGPKDPELKHLLTELGFHGHSGKNGRRRVNAKDVAIDLGPGVVGHLHSTEVYNDGVVIGTGTGKKPSYGADGYNSWTQTVGIVGPYGGTQVVEFKDGEWFNVSGEPAAGVRPVHPAGYPRLESERWDGTNGGQMDQWSAYGERVTGKR